MNIGDLPRAVRALLSLTLPEDWRDDILRDLEEAWSTRRAARGSMRAGYWLWGQAVIFSLRFTPERVRDLAEGRGPTSTDLKPALRAAAHAPFMTVLTIASLSVGIGASVTAFTAIDGLALAELPFEGGDRIVLIQNYDKADRYPVEIGAAEFIRRRDAVRSFEYLSAFFERSRVIGEATETAAVARVFFATPGLLRMTGVPPMLGRLPDAADTHPGAEPVVVLPRSAWVRLTGADPGAVGTPITIGGVRRTIIGVMPEGFGFPWREDLWVPMDVRDADAPLLMLGKLHPGVDRRTAQAEMSAVSRPDPARLRPGADVVHLVSPLTRPTASEAELLLLAVPIGVLILLLVVMATNVANLVLARNATRSSELAIRSAIGASRARVVGQLVLEVAFMVAAATGLGLWLSRVAMSAAEARFTDLPVWTDFSLGPGAVLFTLALGGLVTLVAGVGPALRATGSSPAEALKDGGGGSGVRFGRLTGTLIVAQITIGVGFLSGATILGRSLLTSGFDRYGLPAQETLVAQVYLAWPPELSDPESLPCRRDDPLRQDPSGGASTAGRPLRRVRLSLSRQPVGRGIRRDRGNRRARTARPGGGGRPPRVPAVGRRIRVGGCGREERAVPPPVRFHVHPILESSARRLL